MSIPCWAIRCSRRFHGLRGLLVIGTEEGETLRSSAEIQEGICAPVGRMEDDNCLDTFELMVRAFVGDVAGIERGSGFKE